MQTIQAVERAFGLLEIIADKPEMSFGLNDVAGRARLNASTCSRLLATLVLLGYVEQVGHKGAYRLGPMAFALAAKGPYRQDLIHAAEPLMLGLAESLQIQCTLVALRGGRRYSLCEVSGGQPVSPYAVKRSNDGVCVFPTGRLLLAHLSEAEMRVWLDENGVPSSDWPEVRSEAALRRQLRQIAEAGVCIRRDPKGFAAFAVPVFEGDRCVASLGAFMVDAACGKEREVALTRKLKSAAAEISGNMGKRFQRS